MRKVSLVFTDSHFVASPSPHGALWKGPTKSHVIEFQKASSPKGGCKARATRTCYFLPENEWWRRCRYINLHLSSRELYGTSISAPSCVFLAKLGCCQRCLYEWNWTRGVDWLPDIGVATTNHEKKSFNPRTLPRNPSTLLQNPHLCVWQQKSPWWSWFTSYQSVVSTYHPRSDEPRGHWWSYWATPGKG